MNSIAETQSIPVRLISDDEPDLAPMAKRIGQSTTGELVEPIPGPHRAAPTKGRVAAPRLARHEVTLEDGHRVGVAISGRGMPLVVIHGFTAEGFLYAQSLSRLVSMGFKVIAIDSAGHGGTQGLPGGGANFESYTKLLSRVLDELGIRRAIFAGHSMGGRLITQLAASEPDRVVALICIDAIVGETWDRRVNAMRLFPPAAGFVGVALAIDSLLTVPLFGNREQAAKLLRLVSPTLIGHVRHPWRVLAPGLSIVRSRGSRWMLQRIAQEHIPFFALHGDRDLAVPLKTAIDASRRARGQIVTVHGGTHSWVLRDPETLPGIIAELLQGTLGDAYNDAIEEAGLDPRTVSIDQIEDAFFDNEALALALTPPLEFVDSQTHRREPSFEWTIADHRARHADV